MNGELLMKSLFSELGRTEKMPPCAKVQLPFRLDRKMDFTYVNVTLANVAYANITHVKHIITMFVKINIFKFSNGFRFIWIFLTFFSNSQTMNN